MVKIIKILSSIQSKSLSIKILLFDGVIVYYSNGRRGNFIDSSFSALCLFSAGLLLVLKEKEKAKYLGEFCGDKETQVISYRTRPGGLPKCPDPELRARPADWHRLLLRKLTMYKRKRER